MKSMIEQMPSHNSMPVAKILTSLPLAQEIREHLGREFQNLSFPAKLDIVLVGNDSASQIYVRNKLKFAQSIGVNACIHHLDPQINVAHFTKQIQDLGDSEDNQGILIQLPVPAQLRGLDLSTLIPWHKDVDGFHPYNLGRLIQNRPIFVPCTPKGIVRLMEFYEIPIKGQLIVIIGRSLLVGRPLAAMLTNLHGTVILTHSKTQNLKELTQMADIIVLAMGKAKFLTPEYLGKKRPYVIDVGINKDAEGKICGDADFSSLLPFVQGITPVPGGIGPMTVAGLGENLLLACQQKKIGWNKE